MRRDLIRALCAFTQLSVSVAVCFLLWIAVCAWLKNIFNLGNYIMVIGVFLGAGSGMLSFFKYIKEFISSSKEDKK